MDSKPTIYSIIGPNGAGKSTNARLLVDVEHFDFDATLSPQITDVEPDILNDDFAFDFYRAECIKDVQQKLKDWSSSLINQKKSFSLAHNFLPGYNSNDDVVSNAVKQGYSHHIFYLGINDIMTCIQRVEERLKKGEHFTKAEEIKHRYDRGLEQLNEILNTAISKKPLRIPFDEIRIIDCSRIDFIPIRIADFHYSKGKIQIHTKDKDIIATWKELIPVLSKFDKKKDLGFGMG